MNVYKRLISGYAAKYRADVKRFPGASLSEPSEESIILVLSGCVRRPRPGEVPAIQDEIRGGCTHAENSVRD